MISVSVHNTSLFDVRAEAYAFFVEEEFVFSKELEHYSEKHFPQLRALLVARGFNGKALASVAVPLSLEDRVAYLIFVGLGKKDDRKAFDIELMRRASATLIRVAEQIKVSSISLHLPHASWFNTTTQELAKQCTVSFKMAGYHFDLFLTDPAAKLSRDITIELSVNDKERAAVQEGVKHGVWIGEAVNSARTWVDLPPVVLHPTQLADYAHIIAQDNNLTFTRFHEEEIVKMGMGGIEAVSRGSDRDAQFVIMEYKTEHKDAPTLAFVGKGITFDSGGLSIKPANAMEDMKDDMSGAAAVIAAMGVIAKLKPAVNIIGLAPICENMPSGKATRPGDVIRFYNGKTAEVRNTDAEGRLILADALSYAVQHYQPDFIIDLATLTGACAYALGPFYSGMMSKFDDCVATVEKAAALSGDRVWRLPFHDDYKAAIKSVVADICNAGNNRYRAGSITAGFFLSNFVGDTPWVHLDIAGTAFDVPDMPYYRAGNATGVGVRLLIELAMAWK